METLNLTIYVHGGMLAIASAVLIVRVIAAAINIFF
jgi:hypothetical protein